MCIGPGRNGKRAQRAVQLGAHGLPCGPEATNAVPECRLRYNSVSKIPSGRGDACAPTTKTYAHQLVTWPRPSYAIPRRSYPRSAGNRSLNLPGLSTELIRCYLMPQRWIWRCLTDPKPSQVKGYNEQCLLPHDSPNKLWSKAPEFSPLATQE